MFAWRKAFLVTEKEGREIHATSEPIIRTFWLKNLGVGRLVLSKLGLDREDSNGVEADASSIACTTVEEDDWNSCCWKNLEKRQETVTFKLVLQDLTGFGISNLANILYHKMILQLLL